MPMAEIEIVVIQLPVKQSTNQWLNEDIWCYSQMDFQLAQLVEDSNRTVYEQENETVVQEERSVRYFKTYTDLTNIYLF